MSQRARLPNRRRTACPWCGGKNGSVSIFPWVGALIVPRFCETATGIMNDGRVVYGFLFFLIKTAAGSEPGWIQSPKMRHGIPALVNEQDALFEDMIEYILIPVAEFLGVVFGITKAPLKNIFFSPPNQVN